jgi:hypothetical protein
MVTFQRPTNLVIFVSLSLYILNVIDATSTAYLVDKGASEINPFMAVLLELNIWLFLFFKIFVVGTLAAWLTLFSMKPMVTIFLNGVALFYAILTVFHLTSIWSLL